MGKPNESTGRATPRSDIGRYAMVPLWLIERVSPRALAVFALIGAEFADRAGEAWPGRTKLAKRLAISVPTLDKAMAELVAAGAVEKRVRNSEEGGNLTNLYTLLYAHPEMRGGGQADEATPGKPALPEPEPPTQKAESSLELSASETPKAVRVGGRDLAFDALAEVCGIRNGSPRVKEIPVALNGEQGIRAQIWREMGHPEYEDPENYERQIAIEIRARAVLYRQRMPGAALTPTALAKWWTDLPGLPEVSRGSGSGADVVDAVDAAVRRSREESQ